MFEIDKLGILAVTETKKTGQRIEEVKGAHKLLYSGGEMDS